MASPVGGAKHQVEAPKHEIDYLVLIALVLVISLALYLVG